MVMISELQAIFSPDLMPMLFVNGLAAILGICLLIVAMPTETETAEASSRQPAGV
jgi:hypothetical protein